MSNLRTICRPHTVFTSFMCCRHQARFSSRVSFRNPNYNPRFAPVSDFARLNWSGSWFGVNQRRTMVKASNWDQPKSPYETLGDWIFLNWEKFKASRFDFVNSGISNKFIVSVFFFKHRTREGRWWRPDQNCLQTFGQILSPGWFVPLSSLEMLFKICKLLV